jgi:hypothetical protein
MAEVQIRLLGLTKFDRDDLGEREGIEYEAVPLDAGTHGEVATFTALVALPLIGAVAAFFLSSHKGQTFEEDLEVVYPDGRVVRRTVRYRAHSSQAPEAEIIRQILGGGLPKPP